MDEGWLTVAIRLVPFVLVTMLVRTLPRVLEREKAEQRYRRTLVIQVLWAASFAMLVGSLARVGVVSAAIASLLYTAVGVVISIVAAALLYVFVWKPRARS